MTREEAIAFLYSIAGNLGFTDCENYTCKDGDKMREAIKLLEQESCKDMEEQLKKLKAELDYAKIALEIY